LWGKRKDLSSRPPKYYWKLCRKIRWWAVFHRNTDS
ncbi:polymorphic outer membrane protein, partial [Chlamydia psittaci 03DC29]